MFYEIEVKKDGCWYFAGNCGKLDFAISYIRGCLNESISRIVQCNGIDRNIIWKSECDFTHNWMTEGF